MPIETRALHPLIACEMSGIDLGQGVDAAAVDAIWAGDRPLTPSWCSATSA